MFNLAMTILRVRRRVLDVVSNVVIVGGVLVTPLGGIVAIVGLMLPGDAPLHQFRDLIYIVTALWFLMALIGAHLSRQHDEADRPSQ